VAKRAKKPSPRKLTHRRKTSRKKNTPVFRRRKKNPEQAVEQPAHKAGVLSVQIDVWTAYESTRSVKAAAKVTGHAEHVVREVLASDTQRQYVIIDDFLEACVSEWETKQVRAHGIMNRLFELFERLMDEIGQAQEEGRPTKILDRAGVPLPVLDAIELMVVSKLFDQAAKCAQVAHSISEQYRRGRGPGAAVDAGVSGNDQFEKWDDRRLAEAIKAGGLKLPLILEKKIRQLESA